MANTNDGLASARARGRVGGRRPKFTEDQAALAQRLYDEREKTVQQIDDMFGVRTAKGLPKLGRGLPANQTVPSGR